MTATDPRATAARTPARPPVPHRLSTTLLGLVPGLTVLVATALVVTSWRDDLPDPVAVHFGQDRPDGYGSVGGTLALMLGVFGTLTVAIWLLAVLRGRDSMTRRIAVGTATGLAVFGSLVLGGTLWLQRGLTDAADTPDVDPVIGLALAAGLVAGGLCAWAAPGDAPAPASAGHVPLAGARLPLGAQERAAWTGRVVSRVALGVGGGATLVVAVLVAVLDMPALILLVLALLLLVLTSTVIVVTVDARGLSARSALGWPRFHVPLDEVESVTVRQVRPLREFGGWGFRVGLDGQVGYVVRTGEAIEVGRTRGRSFVVTVDDAATGAALLTTLADRKRTETA